MADFDNKVVIVTGAASGIGLACATLFGQHGARVVISDVDDKKGEQAVAQVQEAGVQAAYKACNVAKPEQVEALVQFALDTYGGLHVMVNNAGIGGAQAPTAEHPLDAWQQVIDINLSGVFYGTRYAIPAILKSGGGAIVNVASILGAVAFANSVAYVAAKHGVVGLTRTTALEYSAKGIRVNAVGPGFIRTPLLSSLEEQPEVMEMLIRAHPIGRLGEPHEVAELVVWLASDRASFCTGNYYAVDGGYLAQ
jgi:NAD(P)-dependent dehydrogenase (short-subunit alcohol dehydrogenase family)